MNTDEFVELIVHHVRDAAIEDVIGKLISPPGRRVPTKTRDRSSWFNGLSERDSENVKSIVESAVDEAIFGLFAVLDGSRVIVDGHFELRYIFDENILLNDPKGIGLNEVFNAK